MSVTIVSWKPYLCKGGDNGQCDHRGVETYSYTTHVETGISKLWTYLPNDPFVVKAVDGRKMREDKNLFVGIVE